MKILSIDASSKSTGIAIFENKTLIHCENIVADSSDPINRINKMVKRIQELYLQYKPTDVVLQDVLPQDVRHNQNVFKVLIYLQAAIVLILHDFNQRVQLYTASHWRKLCGIKTGRGVKRDSLKQASVELVKVKFGLNVNDDVSDAVCLGWAYWLQHGSAF